MLVVFPTVLHASVLAYALVGGVFLAFSDFIMRALALSASGAGTMQVINKEVFRWVFMALFLGLAPVSLLLALYALFSLGGLAGTLIAAGALSYLVGVFAVTIMRNVPLNNALADMATQTAETETYWLETYVPRWRFWNTLRTLACVLAALLTQVGLSVLIAT